MFTEREAQSMVQRGIGIMLIVVVLGAVAIPVADQSLQTEVNDVTNETINSSGSLSEVIAVDEAPDGVVEDSETIRLRNETGGELLLLSEEDNYNTRYAEGEFNITNLTADFESSLDSNDQYLVTYEGKPDGFIGGTAGTVADFVPLALALAIFIAAISLVRG